MASPPYNHRSSIIDIKFSTNDTSLLDDSLIFITPYVSDFRVGSFGPQIFKSDGTLIWNGNHTAKVRAMDAHVCDYLGQVGKHICYNDARPVEQAGHSAGAIRFFDNTYTQVGPDFGAEGDLRAPDIHELNTPPSQNGETFIQDVYQIKEMDLRDYKGPEQGYVLDGCFQEVYIRNRTVHFQWCASDHIPLWHSRVYLYGVGSPNFSLPISGNGRLVAPWDWFHINAISRSHEGDYAISSRHLDTIYKIAGRDNVHGLPPGEIMWRLGGKADDFQKNFTFGRQHTVRFHSVEASESVISLFDNSFDGYRKSANSSSGKMIRLNNETMEATLVAQYDVPGGGLSFSQGSIQLLENGNVFIGWGNRHIFSEYTFDGDLLYHASFSGNVESFRAWKSPWQGFPKQSPKVLGFAANCSAPMYAHVSWNGATEVRAWRVYVSNTTPYGPWRAIGDFNKTGFETPLNASDGASALGSYAPYMYVDALDINGTTLRSSDVVHTFVPLNSTIAETHNCTDSQCDAPWFRFEEDVSCGGACLRDYTPGAYALLGLICLIELLAWLVCFSIWYYTDDDEQDYIPYTPSVSIQPKFTVRDYSNGESQTRRRISRTAIRYDDTPPPMSGLSNLLTLFGVGDDEPLRSNAHSPRSPWTGENFSFQPNGDGRARVSGSFV